MGASGSEIDAWLLNGGQVITASDRAARAVAAAYHRARLAEGFAAWPAPQVQEWSSFVRFAWRQRAQDSRLILNPVQEQALWAEIAVAAGHEAALLEGPRHRLAALAMKAHDLLCSYAPQFLRESARSGWQQDAAAFSGWLSAFDRACRSGNLLAPSRLPLELAALFQDSEPVSAPNLSQRPPLLLAGFDRILPAQRTLFDAWGVWREADRGLPAAQVHFHQAANFDAELSACAHWCSSQIASNPGICLLVITQKASAHRGQIERAFLSSTDPLRTGPAQLFEFSLGIPLSQAALAHGALLVLRWLNGTLAEEEVDWLLSTGQTATSPEESSDLETYMRALRRRGLERTHWTLAAFMGQLGATRLLPTLWLQRIAEARRRLASLESHPQSPLDWAQALPQLLETAGWPGFRPLSSAEFQAFRRWQQAVEAVGSLGFNDRRMSWQDFLSALARALEETLFAPESHDAPIQIAGPAESAGLTADAIWFLGAEEDSWPPNGSMHPLLPPEIQRAAAMPHASPQLDGMLAQSITDRMLASAPEVHFSFARQTEIAEARPSRLIAKIAGTPQELPEALPGPDSLTIQFEDSSRIPFPPGEAGGGASVLTAQSQCPFKAFATARLAAQGWQLAQAGLTPSQRGQLLHSVLHAIWAGPPSGIRTRDQLLSLKDRSTFVADHVHRVFESELRREVREIMPRRYLELEEQRLIRLVTEWLDYEATRVDFAVEGTEVDRTFNVAGLTLDLRLDRLDRLNDGSVLVVDYKSGDVSPHAWDLPRPDDVQLPLYAGFALEDEEPLGGLVFAKIRAGKNEFAGFVGAARETLIEKLRGNTNLVKKPLSAEMLIDWRNCIDELARDFVAGRAEVDPRESPKTCERCGLQTLCRIQEHPAPLETEGEEAGNE